MVLKIGSERFSTSTGMRSASPYRPVRAYARQCVPTTRPPARRRRDRRDDGRTRERRPDRGQVSVSWRAQLTGLSASDVLGSLDELRAGAGEGTGGAVGGARVAPLPAD
jgi:hypothetical protein